MRKIPRTLPFYFVFSVNFFLIISLVILFSVLAVRQNYQLLRTQVADFKTETAFEFAVASEAVRALSNEDAVQLYIRDKNLLSRIEVENVFVEQIEKNPRYDQIRLFDESGEEIVRVDQKSKQAIVIPTIELQNKTNRYYFTDTKKLEEGEMYVSPLDLNIENGEIERPFKPTIRISTPLYVGNDFAGILIINYKAEEVLNQLKHAEARFPETSLFFLNSDGYFFKGPSETAEWGFMFSGREDEVFKKYYPSAWEKIRENDTGIVFSREGVFLYEKIFPIQEVQFLQKKGERQFSYYTRYLSVRDFHLIVVSHITPRNAVYLFVTKVLAKPALIFIAWVLVVVLVRALLTERKKNK